MRIPYDVLMRIAGPEVLRASGRANKREKRNRKPKSKVVPGLRRFNLAGEQQRKEQIDETGIDRYMPVAKLLASMGVTTKDLLEWQQQQFGTPTLVDNEGREEDEGQTRVERSEEDERQQDSDGGGAEDNSAK